MTKRRWCRRLLVLVLTLAVFPGLPVATVLYLNLPMSCPIRWIYAAQRFWLDREIPNYRGIDQSPYVQAGEVAPCTCERGRDSAGMPLPGLFTHAPGCEYRQTGAYLWLSGHLSGVRLD